MITRRALTRLCARVDAITPSPLEALKAIPTAELHARIVNRADLMVGKIDGMIARGMRYDPHRGQKCLDSTARMTAMVCASHGYPADVVGAVNALHVAFCRLQQETASDEK